MPYDPKQALDRLKQGNLRFARDAPLRPAASAEQRQALAAGQQPFAHVLTCADSRVSPEILFDQGLGDLFVTRVAGNVVDDVVTATMELSVDALDIPLIVVLGHSGCAAIASALGGQEIGCLSHLRSLLRPAIDRAAELPGDPHSNVIRENVLLRRNFLRQCEPVLAPRCRQGRLQVAGALYDLATGVVTWLD